MNSILVSVSLVLSSSMQWVLGDNDKSIPGLLELRL